MKVGTLVRWTGDSEDYGCLGLVTKEEEGVFWVTWADGDVVDYWHKDIHGEKLEVLCK